MFGAFSKSIKVGGLDQQNSMGKDVILSDAFCFDMIWTCTMMWTIWVQFHVLEYLVWLFDFEVCFVFILGSRHRNSKIRLPYQLRAKQNTHNMHEELVFGEHDVLRE